MRSGSSKRFPKKVIERNGNIQIRINVTKVAYQDEQELDKIRYDYDYIELAQPISRKTIIDTLVRDRYDVNDEFAMVALPANDPEYVEYREYIGNCKIIADEVLSEL